MFCYFYLKLLHGQRVTFWRLSFFNIRYLMALSGWGLSLSLFLPVHQIQLEAVTHSVTVGFSTVWPSLTTKVPRVLTQAAVYRRMYRIPSHGSFIPWWFGSSRATFILTYMTTLFANKLILKSTPCSVIFTYS